MVEISVRISYLVIYGTTRRNMMLISSICNYVQNATGVRLTRYLDNGRLILTRQEGIALRVRVHDKVKMRRNTGLERDLFRGICGIISDAKNGR